MIRLFTLFLLVFVHTGCGFVHRNTVGLFQSSSTDGLEPAPPRQESAPLPPAEQSTSSVAIEKLPEKQDLEPTDEIEIIWEIPKQSVDGFVLKYGYNRDDLPFEKRLSNEEVERFVHPSFGPVFRYVLHGIPTDQRVFVGMATIDDEKISELSDIFEVTPNPPADEKGASPQNP